MSGEMGTHKEGGGNVENLKKNDSRHKTNFIEIFGAMPQESLFFSPNASLIRER